MNKLWTVLRSGGEYHVEHVALLARQLRKVAPDAELVCLSDIKFEIPRVEVIPLLHDWPRWWSKLELCRPKLADYEDVLFCDLDTVLIGDLTDIFAQTGTIVLRDFFEQGNWIGSGFMRLTSVDRAAIWAKWMTGPDGFMEQFSVHGDQKFMEGIIGTHAERWQSVLPGQIVSYKADMVRKGRSSPPDGARVVCFHGQPRPWAVDQAWISNAALAA